MQNYKNRCNILDIKYVKKNIHKLKKKTHVSEIHSTNI
jgi:hypothetical protein